MKILPKHLQRIIEEETKKVVKLKKEEQQLKRQLQERLPASDVNGDGQIDIADMPANDPLGFKELGPAMFGQEPYGGALGGLRRIRDEAAAAQPAPTGPSNVQLPVGQLQMDMPTAPAPAPKGKGKRRAPVKARGASNSKDSQVTMQIQQALGIKADGIYGPQTTRSVKQFFASKGQPVPSGPNFSAAIAAQLAAIQAGGGGNQRGAPPGGGGGGGGGGGEAQAGIKPVDDRTAIQKAGELADDLDEMYVTDSQLSSAVEKLKAMEKEFGPSGLYKIAQRYEGASGTAAADGLTALGNEIDDIDDWMGGQTKTLKALAKDILTKANAWNVGGSDPSAPPPAAPAAAPSAPPAAAPPAPPAPAAPPPAAAAPVATPPAPAATPRRVTREGKKVIVNNSYLQQVIKEELRNVLKI